VAFAAKFRDVARRAGPFAFTNPIPKILRAMAPADFQFGVPLRYF
jgi:hypothetical protein